MNHFYPSKFRETIEIESLGRLWKLKGDLVILIKVMDGKLIGVECVPLFLKYFFLVFAFKFVLFNSS